MDVHSRYRTEGTKDADIIGRFNERFLLSLSRCNGCLFIDDLLNVLPISSFSRTFLSQLEGEDFSKDLNTLQEQELLEVTEFASSFPEDSISRSIVKLCKTTDQAKAVASISETLSSKSLRFTISLIASRGRGKSAALGLAIAMAVMQGFSNIFVTSPSPSNLGTLFAFLFKGLEAFGYKEHTHYDAVQATSNELAGIILRVNIFKSHRQTIQYIAPEDFRVLGQAELVVIDEAAAIPLPLVKSLLGPYLVLLSSTIHGYEGTGRSLSLKLIQQLKEQQGGPSGRSLKELKLDAPIRYAKEDPIELWLNSLLCFDAIKGGFNKQGLLKMPTPKLSCPHPKDCQLFYVNRDTLFSFHEASEIFLQKMMFLYVSSHYKNTPNDLQLMSDAPAHHLFLLLGPVADSDDNSIPEILCVIQVCIEGALSRSSIIRSVTRGQRGGGDLIPWTLSTQFQDTEFASLSGARIVRIATHPELQKMGYGTRAMALLESYYRGEMLSEELSHEDSKCSSVLNQPEEHFEKNLIEPRSNLPPLLSRLSERAPEKLDWIGVSYGLTQGLAKFWKRADFVPVYLRQTKNDLTGEHTLIMLKSFDHSVNWLMLFFRDFYSRFYNLLPIAFRDLPTALALELMHLPISIETTFRCGSHDHKQAKMIELSKFDIRRLEAYFSNTIDFHVILDLVPIIARNYFMGNVSLNSSESLTPVQSALLLSLGTQMKSIDELVSTLGLASSQLLAMLAKIMKKFFIFYRTQEEETIKESLPCSNKRNEPLSFNDNSSDTRNPTKRSLNDAAAWDPVIQSLDDDLTSAAVIADAAFRAKQQELINSLDVSKYAIDVLDETWHEALKTTRTSSKTSNLSIQKEGKSSSDTGIFKNLQEKEVREKSKRISKALHNSQKRKC